ncbi:MAG: alkaline phosphatase family protein [Firmicutes bacterium]|nr:alkaline phosphatase family protein [Bacillota bacterium]
MKRVRYTVCFVLLVIVSLLCLSASVLFAAEKQSGHKIRAILITEDACNAELTDSLAESGKLPYLCEFRKKAARAEYVTAHFPNKTAPGHASLYCACYGNKHGITCNDVNKGKNHTILDLESGYSSTVMMAEPVWVASAKQGMKTLLVDAMQCSPAKTYLKSVPPGSLIIVNGYNDAKSDFEVITEKQIQPADIVRKSLPEHEYVMSGRFQVGDTTLYIARIDNSPNGKKDFSSIIISPDANVRNIDAVTLKAGKKGYSGVVPVKFGKDYAGVHFMLLSLDQSGKEFRIVKSSIHVEEINDKSPDIDYIRKTGGFCAEGSSGPYFDGSFGKTIPQGGDGTAEELYLESVDLINRQLSAKVKYCTEKYKPDFVVGYTPYPDEALHWWFGYADYKKTGFDPDKGEKLKHYLEQSFISADRYLGSVLELASKDTYIVVASDHAMDSCNKMFYPNTILKKAGLLATDENGRIDPSRTKILYGLQNGAFFLVNTTDYKNGIVPPAEKAQVVRQAVDVLSRARDPKTHESIITGFYYPDTDESFWGIGGPRGGDLYIDVKTGYYLSSAVKPDYAKDADPMGVHVFIPSRRNMHSMFYISGPDVDKKVYKPCRIIDIVPTLMKYLKIKPPADCKGKPVS